MAVEHRFPRGWRYVTIAELEKDGLIAEIQDGNHGERHPKSTDYVPTGIPFVMAKDIVGDRLDLENCSFIAKTQADSLRIGFARPGDVLLTHKATMGRVAIVPSGFEYVMLTPQVTYYRIGDPERLANTYLRYAFRGPDFQYQLNSDSDQSTRKYIGITAQRRLRVPLPPPNDQRAIAHVLGTLDDKIELNRRMNETLEAIARTLFKSWFVDFDPVRAKAEGRDPGPPKAIADLFPHSFEESELGKIPKGWTVTPLSKAVAVNPRRALSKGEVAPYLDMANVPTRLHVPDEIIERPFGSGMRFINGDTLVARITPCLENGKTAFVDFLPDGQVGWGSTEYIVLRPEPPLPSEYAYCVARSQEFRDFAIQSMTGTSGRQRVPAAALSHFLVALPNKDVAVLFGKLVGPLFSRVRVAAEENRALSLLRDTLLPKLISGELRVTRDDKLTRGEYD